MRLKSIFTNSFGILISRITGLGRDVLMASALGASIWSDIFFVAFKIPNLFRRIFAEGAFTQAFLPSFIASSNKGVFAIKIFLRFLLFLFAFSLVITIFPEPITYAIAWGWSSEDISKTAPLVAINFWYLDLIFIVTFLATLLQYREHFATTALSTALLNISMIVALYLYMKSSPKEVAYAVSFSVLVGGFLQILVHLIASYKFNLQKILIGGWNYRKRKDTKEEEKKFNNLFLPSILGNATPQIASFIDTLLATFLVSGSVSYLFYANRVFQLPLALIAIATTTVLFPSISKALKNNQENRAYKELKGAFWFLLYLLGIAMIIGISFSEPIIWLLFERGKFGLQETKDTALVLQMYLVGLLPFGLAKLFALFLYATKRHKKAAIISIISLVFTILFSLVLMNLMGASGLALSGSIGGFILLVLTIKEVGFAKLKEIIYIRPTAYFLWLIMTLGFIFSFINSWLVEIIRV